MIQYEGESYIELAEIRYSGVIHRAIELPKMYLEEPESLHGTLVLACGEVVNIWQFQNDNWHCFLGKEDQISCICCKEEF